MDREQDLLERKINAELRKIEIEFDTKITEKALITDELSARLIEAGYRLLPAPDKDLVEQLELTKEEREACVPTEKELTAYIATPDDKIAARLRKELSPSDFRVTAFVILHGEKIEKAAFAKAYALIEQGVREKTLELIDKTFSDKITKGEMTATHAWQNLKGGK